MRLVGDADADGHGDAYVVQPLLFLRKNADVRMRQRLARMLDRRRIERCALELIAEQLLRLREVLIERPLFQQVLETRLLPVRAVAVRDVHAHHGGDHLVQFRRLHQARVHREIAVTRMTLGNRE